VKRIESQSGLRPKKTMEQPQQPAVVPSPEARQRWYLRLRGLPWGTTQQTVADFFEGIEIDLQDISVLKMPDGRDSGEALVGFRTAEDQKLGESNDKKYLKNRYIEILSSTAREWERVNSRSDASLPVPIQEDSFVLLMRGLPYSAHPDDCVAFFGEDAQCLGVHLTKDEKGRPSGRGYAEFPNDEEYQKALKRNGQHMMGRYIELFESNHEDLSSAVTGGQSRSGRSGAAAQTHADMQNPYMIPPSEQFQGQIPHCARLRGLPYNTTDKHITDFFSEVSVRPTRIHRKGDGTEAFVEFNAEDELNTAMKRHKDFMGNRYVEIFRADYYEMMDRIRPASSLPSYQPFQGGRGSYSRQYNPYAGRGAPRGRGRGRGRGRMGNPYA